MFRCYDCKEKIQEQFKSYSYMVDGKWQSSCQFCVNRLEKWAGWLNAVWNPFNKQHQQKIKRQSGDSVE